MTFWGAANEVAIVNINHSPAESLKAEGRSQNPERAGDKIITLDLADKISDAGELEKRRMVNARVNEIILARLQRDATGMEADARTETDLQKCHRLMDTAKCLRVTMTWIAGPSGQPPGEGSNVA